MAGLQYVRVKDMTQICFSVIDVTSSCSERMYPAGGNMFPVRLLSTSGHLLVAAPNAPDIKLDEEPLTKANQPTNQPSKTDKRPIKQPTRQPAN